MLHRNIFYLLPSRVPAPETTAVGEQYSTIIDKKSLQTTVLQPEYFRARLMIPILRDAPLATTVVIDALKR